VFDGKKPDSVPIVPIIHAGLAPIFGVPLGKFFTDGRVMANTLIKGYRTFGYDGVQLSLGVTAEAEAFGAKVDQPENAAPLLREHLLSNPDALGALKSIDPTNRGRFSLFRDALKRVVAEIGKEAFVIVTLRGPLLMAAQLRGVEAVLMDTVDAPDKLHALLDFTNEVSLKMGLSFLQSGAHALMIGEATCSPSFISPNTYREFVLARHKKLISGLKSAGWKTVGLHICGNLMPILEDVLTTGANLLDIDYQVSAKDALRVNKGRAVLRGNLNPSSVFAFGTKEVIKAETAKLKAEVKRQGLWIFSSGCDISPGTPKANIELALKCLR
jgi:MtaA/CmuA family methyltransferase